VTIVLDETSAAPPPASPLHTHDVVWFLVGRMDGSDVVRQIPICNSPFRVGRSPAASLSLATKEISSTHAEFVSAGISLLLRDLGSTNGTFVNGKQIHDTVELNADDLVQFASVPFRVVKQSAGAHEGTIAVDALDHAMLLVQFDRLMNERAFAPHYQPIIDVHTNDVLAYEVLVRSKIMGLEGASAMFGIAAQLNVQTKLSQMMRAAAVQEVAAQRTAPHLFLNTHPLEIGGDELVASLRTLREMASSLPITIEIHEGAIAELSRLRKLRADLRELNMSLAFDDFGAGQARLTELIEVHPEYLKFDMSLIRNIDRAPKEKVQMVRSLVHMALEMGIIPLAEGVETTLEREACIDVGFQLGQGYLFGKPVPLKLC
jgi:EAL domain-containing protein (putative c-di-GMP-specific phosphodiesterase class I)